MAIFPSKMVLGLEKSGNQLTQDWPAKMKLNTTQKYRVNYEIFCFVNCDCYFGGDLLTVVFFQIFVVTILDEICFFFFLK